MSPGITTVPPQLIGTLISPGPSLSQPPGHTDRLYAGNAEPRDALDVANGAVDDDAAESCAAAAVWHISSPNTALVVLPHVFDHHDVARLAPPQRLVHHQVVGRAGR